MTMEHMFLKHGVNSKGNQMQEIKKLMAEHRPINSIRVFRTGINGYYSGKGGIPWPYPYQMRDWIDLSKAPEEVLQTSSVCLFTAMTFTDKLPRGTHHPIGIMTEAVSATRIECWMPMSAIEKCDPVYKAYPSFERVDHPQLSTGHCSWKSSGLERAALFEERIAPVVRGTRLAATIFYQGEQNVDDRQQAYGCSYSELVKSYRQLFKGDFPWIVVQVAPTGNSNTFNVRSAQKLISDEVPNVHLVVTNDLGSTFRGRKRHPTVDAKGNGPPDGSGADIHPNHKFEVGERVATQLVSVLGLGKSQEYISGPKYQRATWQGTKLAVNFGAGQGLKWVPSKECLLSKSTTCCGPKNTMVRLSKAAINDIAKNTLWDSAPSEVTSSEGELLVSPAGKFSPGDYKSMQLLYEDYPECVLKNKANLPASPVLASLVAPAPAPAPKTAPAAVHKEKRHSGNDTAPVPAAAESQ